MKKQLGFTLIELLVVIAIIAILAAILFPVFTSVRKSAYLSTCTSNMKQFALAINLYRADNNGNLPQALNIWSIDYNNPMSTMQWNYFDGLYPYFKNLGVAKCPSKAITAVKKSLDALWYEAGGTTPSRWYGAVYTPSLWGWAKGSSGSGPMAAASSNLMGHMVWSHGSSVVNPDSVDYRSKYNCRSTEAVMLFCMSGTWTISWDKPSIRRDFPDGIAHGSHDHGTPALFADSHVKFVDYTRVGNL